MHPPPPINTLDLSLATCWKLTAVEPGHFPVTIGRGKLSSSSYGGEGRVIGAHWNGGWVWLGSYSSKFSYLHEVPSIHKLPAIPQPRIPVEKVSHFHHHSVRKKWSSAMFNPQRTTKIGIINIFVMTRCLSWRTYRDFVLYHELSENI